MNRLPKIILLVSIVPASWLAMQAVHELGHILGALASGGTIKRVVLHPLTISRTDLALNPAPLLVVWAGPVIGVVFPLIAWAIATALKMPGAFVLRFFAGFCLIANGTYIGVGSIDGIGDCGEMLRHGSERWQLLLFGIVSMPLGLSLWHHQAQYFGLGRDGQSVKLGVAYITFAVAILLTCLGLYFGGG